MVCVRERQCGTVKRTLSQRPCMEVGGDLTTRHSTLNPSSPIQSAEFCSIHHRHRHPLRLSSITTPLPPSFPHRASRCLYVTGNHSCSSKTSYPHSVRQSVACSRAISNIATFRQISIRGHESNALSLFEYLDRRSPRPDWRLLCASCGRRMNVTSVKRCRLPLQLQISVYDRWW